MIRAVKNLAANILSAATNRVRLPNRQPKFSRRRQKIPHRRKLAKNFSAP